MASLGDSYEDARRAKELVEKLWDDFVYDNSANLGQASDLAEEASELLNQIAVDFAAVEQALIETRGE